MIDDSETGFDERGARSVGPDGPSAVTRGAWPRWARRRALSQVIAGVIVVGAALAACSPLGQTCCTHGPTGAPGGLSQDAAIARARESAPGSGPSTTVIWASIENDPFGPRGTAPPGPLVWIVRLQGGLTASPCPSGFLDRPASRSDSACLDGDGGINVVLDFFSGAFLGWTH